MRDYLAWYKRNVLGVSEPGLWRYKKQLLPHDHILPTSQLALNVLEGMRNEFWDYFNSQKRCEPRPATLHRDFVSLTSSQALAFNLFFPFLGSSRSDALILLAALEIPHASLRSWRFECVLDSKEGTNFDACLTLDSGKRVLIEVKFTESGFGTCKNNASHQAKLRDCYSGSLAGKVESKYLEVPGFFRHYQLLRNVSYADEQTLVLFVVPKANEGLASGVAFLKAALQTSFRPYVRVVFLEDLVSSLKALTVSGPLQSDLDQFSEKYLPTDEKRSE